MIYINKNVHRAEGDQITKDYLYNVCRNPDDGRYRNIYYRHDRHLYFNGIYRTRMIDVLLAEQNALCCYCLRKLDRNSSREQPGAVTIEHIIPQCYSQANCERITEYRNAPNLSEQDVVLTDRFEAPETPQNMPPYPHNVAYRNFAASCNGNFPTGPKLCCNHKRGNAFVYPVFFHETCRDLVKYKENGMVEPMPSIHMYKIKEMIDNTNLNNDTLKSIRSVWYLIRNIELNVIRSCTTSETRHRLLSSISDDEIRRSTGKNNAIDLLRARQQINKYIEDGYWNTLMLYDKFHEIMRQQYQLT